MQSVGSRVVLLSLSETLKYVFDRELGQQRKYSVYLLVHIVTKA